MLADNFFNRDASVIAQELLGKTIYRRDKTGWLYLRIIETEAYYRSEKASHSSLGETTSRRAIFMSAGTIYMYYARGGASLNVSCQGAGNAVLIKSAYPDPDCCAEVIATMQSRLPPLKNHNQRPLERLCAGQTLLCRALDLQVKEWNTQSFSKNNFFIKDRNRRPSQIIQTRRLGISPQRDADLLLRYVDYDYADFCTLNPLRKRKASTAQHYRILPSQSYQSHRPDDQED